MNRPKKEDFDVVYVKGDAETSSIIKQYSKAQDSYIDHLEGLSRMPHRLTAENGAKALLSGEFKETRDVYDWDEDGYETYYEEDIPVTWGTIKDIYKKIVEYYKD